MAFAHLHIHLRDLIILMLIKESTTIGHFGYNKRDQHVWAKRYGQCGGKMQSPIAISSFESINWPFPAIEMIGYHNFLPPRLFLKNSGHSVTLSIKDRILNNHLPYIFGASLEPNQRYEVDSLHFHWGGRNDRGSEHTLNDIRYPMEMHIIHRNVVYPNYSIALEHDDGLCVLAIFFQLQEEDNRRLNPLLDNIANVKWVNTQTEMNDSITLASMLPYSLDVFYTYKGSLTTPPCSEVVTWIIFPMPVSISYHQMEKFRTLSNGKKILVDNYRYLQNIGLRKVYARKLVPKKCNVTTINGTNVNWFCH